MSDEQRDDATAEAKDDAAAAGEHTEHTEERKGGPEFLAELDLDRGEIDDDDLAALENAIATIDFATRKAAPERLERLGALAARLSDVVEQVRRGERQPQSERPPLSKEEEERYHRLIDEGVAAGREDLETARACLEEAVRLHPDGVEGLFNLGVVYGLLAHYNIAKMEFYDDHVRDEVFVEKAQVCYDRVLDLEPDHMPSLKNLATLYAVRDQREQAVELLGRLVGLEAKDEEQQRIVREAKDQLAELKSF